jgi:hypothetical protein
MFMISYAVLCGLVVLEASILREALRDIVRLKRFYASNLSYDRRVDFEGPPRGAIAPAFSGTLLGTGETLTGTQLKGDPTILLFVSPSEASSPAYQQLATIIHALWHRVDGHLYLVCSGSEHACRQVALIFRVHGFAENQVPIVIDEEARIARRFHIAATPAAVELDDDLRVIRYGLPIATADEGEEAISA